MSTAVQSTETAHDEHHDHEHHGNFITNYVFSQDHKVIAKQFLITGLFWAFIGGLFSVLFRLSVQPVGTGSTRCPGIRLSKRGEYGNPAQDRGRLVAAGFGEFQPLDPEDSQEARDRNRRIELKLTEK